MARTALENIYATLNEVFGVENQLFCLEMPGRVLNPATYAFDASSVYSNMAKPQPVIEEEYKLSNDLYGLYQMIGGPTGEQLSTVYEKAINRLIPKYPKNSQFIKDKTEMRKWLQEKIRIHYDETDKNGEKTGKKNEFVGTRIELYEMLNEIYLDAVKEWKKKKTKGLTDAQKIKDPKEKELALEAHARMIANEGEAIQARLEARFADLVVRGYYHEIRDMLGYLDIKTGAELLEQTKERMRNSQMMSLDEGSIIYPVNFSPNDWFEELSTDFEPVDLLLDSEFIGAQLMEKEIKLEDLNRQLAKIVALHDENQDGKQQLKADIEEARKNISTAENELLSKYSHSILSFAKIVLGNDEVALTDTASEPNDSPNKKAKTSADGLTLTKEETIAYARTLDEYYTKYKKEEGSQDRGTNDYKDILGTVKTAIGAEATNRDTYLTKEEIADCNNLDLTEAKKQDNSDDGKKNEAKWNAAKSLYLTYVATKEAITTTSASGKTKIAGYLEKKKSEKKAEIQKELVEKCVSNKTGEAIAGISSETQSLVKNAVLKSMKAKFVTALANLKVEDVENIFENNQAIKEAEVKLENANRALLKYSMRASEAKAKDTQLKDDELRSQIFRLEKEAERLREILKNPKPDKSGHDIALTPNAKKSKQRFQDVVVSIDTSTETREQHLHTTSHTVRYRTGFWIFSHSVSRTVTKTTVETDIKKSHKGIKIGMKAMKVTLNRGGWFDPSIFKSTDGMYRFFEGTSKISKGNTPTNNTKSIYDLSKEYWAGKDDEDIYNTLKAGLDDLNKDTLFPAYPIAFIVAKDITIKMKMGEHAEKFGKHVKDTLTQANAGIFCFSINGSGQSSPSNESAYVGTKDGYIIIRIPTPQIIGWYLQPVAEDKSDTHYTKMPVEYLIKDGLNIPDEDEQSLKNSRKLKQSSFKGNKNVVIKGSLKPTGNQFQFMRSPNQASYIYENMDTTTDNIAKWGADALSGQLPSGMNKHKSGISDTKVADYIIGNAGTADLVKAPADFKREKIEITKRDGTKATIVVEYDGIGLKNSNCFLLSTEANHEVKLSDIVMGNLFRNTKTNFILAGSRE